MAVVDGDFLTSILVGVQAIWTDEFPSMLNSMPWTQLTTRVESNGAGEEFSFWGTVPRVQDVTNKPLELGGLTPYSFTIMNRLWKAGFPIKRQAFERDKLQQLRPKVDQLMQEMAAHPGELVLGQLVSNPKAFDGVALFADSRTIGASANIDNKITSSGGVTAAKLRTLVGDARARMMFFQDDHGRPRGKAPTHLVISPNDSNLFYEAFAVGGGSSDVALAPGGQLTTWTVKNYTIMECPQLTTSGVFYALSVGSAFKPFVYQVEIEPKLEGITTIDNVTTILNEDLIYTARGSYNVGVGDPRDVMECTITS